MNIKAIKGMAIVTAFHQLDWCPGTARAEVWDEEFVTAIKEQAYANLEWAKVEQNPVITQQDIAQAIWGEDL
jgi:hypothetical protein